MNNTGKKFGGRTKGTPNKRTQLNEDIKANLEDLLGGIIDGINVNSITTEQKIQLLRLGLQYVIPRLKENMNDHPFGWTERPIFKEIDLDIPIEEDDNYQPQIDMSE